jgi:predicted O-methyltransferase YrrM
MKAIENTGIEYYCQVSDVELIKKIVKELPDSPLCINIGAGMGTSALSMLEARQDSTVISVDIDDCPYEKMVMEETGYCNTDRYWFFKQDSKVFGLNWEREAVDFVFIDGGHRYEECTEDALVWYETLKPNGIMAFHDYESPMLESVKKAVDDVAKMLRLEFVARRGTLIVYRKVANENIPDAG